MPSSVRSFLSIALLSVWIGGLTFYALFVVPIGTQIVGSVEQGAITQAATNRLNIIGFVALAVLAWNAWLSRSRVVRVSWWVLLVVQGGLLVAHFPLDQMLNAESMSIADADRFYAAHQVYLLLTTFQWIAGVVHLWGIVAHLSSANRPQV